MAKQLTPERSFPLPDFQYVSDFALTRLGHTTLGNFQEVLQPLQNNEQGYSLKRGINLQPFIMHTASKDAEVADVMKKLKTAVVVEINGPVEDTQDGHHNRAMLLLEDTDGRRSVETLSLYGTAQGIDPEPGEEFNPLIHKGNFGGKGIYGQKYEGLPRLIDALKHADDLSETMYAKALACGFIHLVNSSEKIPKSATPKVSRVGNCKLALLSAS